MKAYVIHYIHTDEDGPDQVVIAGVASDERTRDLIIDAFADNKPCCSEIKMDTACDAQWGFVKGAGATTSGNNEQGEEG